MKSAFAVIILLLISMPAMSKGLGVPTPGYIYFHKTGADSRAHNAAVEACAAQAALAVAPMVPQIVGGVLPALFYGSEQDSVAGVTFVANVENCMVVNGWEAVRLDDAEGKAIAALDQAGQAAAIAPWIGAETPHGTMARRYQPLRDAVKDGVAIAGFGDRAKTSLSASSDLSNIAQSTSRQPGPDAAKNWKQVELLDDFKKAPDGATALVVRALCVKVCGSMGFVLLSDPANPAGPSLDAAFEFPHAFLNSSLLEKTYVFLVPPGHWRIGNINVFGFCMGGPAFDIAPGQAVFAGTFDGRAMYNDPDMDAAPASKALGHIDIARRLVPAHYGNAESFPCEKNFSAVIYTLDYPKFDKTGAQGSPAATINPPQ